jgi:HD-like signal output (HDOD) protein
MAISHEHQHLQADQAMLAGLIHDIGVLPVLTLAEEYPDLLRDEAKLDRLVESAHTELGKAILRHWNFPETLVKVASEHENLNYDSGSRPDYVDLIIVANLQSNKNRDRLEQAGDLSRIPAFAKLGLSNGMGSVDLEMAASF